MPNRCALCRQCLRSERANAEPLRSVPAVLAVRACQGRTAALCAGRACGPSVPRPNRCALCRPCLRSERAKAEPLRSVPAVLAVRACQGRTAALCAGRACGPSVPRPNRCALCRPCLRSERAKAEPLRSVPAVLAVRACQGRTAALCAGRACGPSVPRPNRCALCRPCLRCWWGWRAERAWAEPLLSAPTVLRAHRAGMAAGRTAALGADRDNWRQTSLCWR